MWVLTLRVHRYITIPISYIEKYKFLIRSLYNLKLTNLTNYLLEFDPLKISISLSKTKKKTLVFNFWSWIILLYNTSYTICNHMKELLTKVKQVLSIFKHLILVSFHLGMDLIKVDLKFNLLFSSNESNSR